mmetsp:Transcript_5650/g.9469  ORF Transcript_5650/g.9469 Transcript_5650/m.9469 type:complete len:80 (+) Transcript_5650:62-301(+)
MSKECLDFSCDMSLFATEECRDDNCVPQCIGAVATFLHRKGISRPSLPVNVPVNVPCATSNKPVLECFGYANECRYRKN